MSYEVETSQVQQPQPRTTEPDAADLHRRLELQFLSRRLATLVSGALITKDDPEEERLGDEMERIWNHFSPEELVKARNDGERRSAAWHDPRSHLVDDSPPGQMGDPFTVWVRALPNAFEVCLPHSTQARLGYSVARTARLVIAWDQVATIPGATRFGIVEAALMLLGLRREAVPSRGGIRFVDPEARTELFAVDVVHVAASGVAETPDPPGAPEPPVPPGV